LSPRRRNGGKGKTTPTTTTTTTPELVCVQEKNMTKFFLQAVDSLKVLRYYT
jgi:hypothetical protein